MDFMKQKPIYLQIADRLMEQIMAGKVEERMPSVREVAALMGVNPNTVRSRARRGGAWEKGRHPCG